MDESGQSASVLQRVLELLRTGFFQLPPGVTAVPGEPMVLHSPSGAMHSWMVPFTAGTKLIAWAHLSPSLEPLRFSLLAGGKPDAAPNAAGWLDPRVVSENVAAAAGMDQQLSQPFLTYDRDPSRVVWMIESRGLDGAVHRWFAAGVNVWEDSGEDEVTGGPPGSLRRR